MTSIGPGLYPFDMLKTLALTTWELTWAKMQARYRKTFVGFFWVLLNPVLTFGVQSLVFKMVLNIHVPNYLMFLLSGLLPWIFIVQSLEMTSNIFTSHDQLLRSFKVSPLIFLWAQILDNFINFIFAFGFLLFVLFFFFPIHLTSLLLLPVLILMLVLGVSGPCLFFSTLHVFYRDTKFIVEFLVGIAFFLTPIFYPLYFVPEKFRSLVYLNPIYSLIEPFQLVLHEGGGSAIFWSLGRGFLLGLVLLTAAGLYWRKKQNEFYLAL